MSKKKEEINLDGLDYEEYLKMRSIYLQKEYKKEAEKSWGKKKGNIEYVKQGVSYAVLNDFNHQ
jgi:hypothetical protein